MARSDDDTAGGLMTTTYIALHDNATVADALEALRGNPDQLDTLNTLLLIDADERLAGVLPVTRILLAGEDKRLKELALDEVVSVDVHEKAKRVSELFDKYNLLTLPVLDEDRRLAGVITADDIISVLRRD